MKKLKTLYTKKKLYGLTFIPHEYILYKNYFDLNIIFLCDGDVYYKSFYRHNLPFNSYSNIANWWCIMFSSLWIMCFVSIFSSKSFGIAVYIYHHHRFCINVFCYLPIMNINQVGIYNNNNKYNVTSFILVMMFYVDILCGYDGTNAYKYAFYVLYV